MKNAKILSSALLGSDWELVGCCCWLTSCLLQPDLMTACKKIIYFRNIENLEIKNFPNWNSNIAAIEYFLYFSSSKTTSGMSERWWNMWWRGVKYYFTKNIFISFPAWICGCITSCHLGDVGYWCCWSSPLSLSGVTPTNADNCNVLKM